MNFLFLFYGIGLIIAGFQDLKRREIDNWLNLFLLFVSSVYIILKSSSVQEIFTLFITILLFFVLVNLFYFGRFFAGGDAKLLFAMAPLFVSNNILSTLFNSGFFLFLLMVSGSIYGICYTIVLAVIHRDKLKKSFSIEISKKPNQYLFIFVCVFLVFGLFFRKSFILGLIALFFLFFYVFAKALEKVAMYKKVFPKDLREGDWLVEDIRVGKKVIPASFEGLSNENLSLIRKTVKNKVLIKDGLPFVPAFILAFILYFFSHTLFIYIF